MSDTRNVKIGVCRIFFDGVDLGFTQGGVEVNVSTETHKVMVDQFGKTPVDEIIMGRTVEAKVPLAETNIETLMKIMPGAVMTDEGGTAASGNVTFTGVPTANDTVTVNGVVFTVKTSPVAANEFAPGASANAAATNLMNALKNYPDIRVSSATYVAVAGAVNITYSIETAEGNAFTLAKSGTNITVSGATLTGGVSPTRKKVSVPTGVSTSLLAIAKKLVLHPQSKPATDKSEDFVIPLAATAGQMQFAYQVEKERIFNVSFMGYPNSITGELFTYGDDSTP